MEHKDVFNNIYVGDLWRSSREEKWPIETNSQVYRPFIEKYIKANEIASIVDIGCGNWGAFKNIDLNGADYTGVDVSDVILSVARQNAPPGTKFINANVLKDHLPKADLLMMKDVLQHWSNADILEFLPKIKQFRHVLITNGFVRNNESDLVNINISPGEWRPVDLTKQPFNLSGQYIFSFDVSHNEVKKILQITNT